MTSVGSGTSPRKPASSGAAGAASPATGAWTGGARSPAGWGRQELGCCSASLRAPLPRRTSRSPVHHDGLEPGPPAPWAGGAAGLVARVRAGQDLAHHLGRDILLVGVLRTAHRDGLVLIAHGVGGGVHRLAEELRLGVACVGLVGVSAGVDQGLGAAVHRRVVRIRGRPVRRVQRAERRGRRRSRGPPPWGRRGGRRVRCGGGRDLGALSRRGPPRHPRPPSRQRAGSASAPRTAGVGRPRGRGAGAAGGGGAMRKDSGARAVRSGRRRRDEARRRDLVSSATAPPRREPVGLGLVTGLRRSGGRLRIRHGLFELRRHGAAAPAPRPSARPPRSGRRRAPAAPSPEAPQAW